MWQVYVNTGGVPNGFAFDPNGVVYICDFAHQAILTLGTAEDANDQQLTAIVKDYEGKSLKVGVRNFHHLLYFVGSSTAIATFTFLRTSNLDTARDRTALRWIARELSTLRTAARLGAPLSPHQRVRFSA